ncbi:hypothetical protein [Streptomyces tropicalis]|uniref:Toxin n=1 Tax=Streptomyces tropicalis TaxID=3034234 RepID=A0ABT6A3I9_9ACTN|nr:hypothetical protein [Streptomyces tropicalis]MDF3299220.1 hypothetical protein [Streptomyces tropicalis]
MRGLRNAVRRAGRSGRRDRAADEVERRSREFLDSLDLPAVGSVLELVPFMEERRQRAIQLVPFEPDPCDPDSLDASAPCGLWLATGSTDYVFYDAGVSRSHAEIIVGHEFAHMLRQHSGNAAKSSFGDLGGLITDIDPGTVQLILGRTRYHDPEEFEAEMLGSLLQERVHAARPVHPADTDPIARTLLRRPPTKAP